MDIWHALLDVLILLFTGVVFGTLLERLGQSSIVGYLLAGAILGPNVVGAIDSSAEIAAISELGVALLLFAIGLEFSWSRLRAMGRAAWVGGVTQVVSTCLLLAFALSFWFSIPAALGLGAIVALSSTASVLRLLAARSEVDSVHGRRALGILLVQDMAVVPLVLLITVANEGGTPLEVTFRTAQILGVVIVLVIALYVLFTFVVPRILQQGARQGQRELTVLLALVSGLGSAVLAHAFGVSPALGAFAAGMLLAETPFATQIRADVSSLRTLLLTLFFSSVGMLAHPAWMLQNALLVGLTVIGIVFGKTLVVWASLRLAGASSRSALATGLCLGQVGEFSFVLAEIARGRSLDEPTFLLVISTALLTMMMTPYLVAWAPWVAQRLTHGRGLEPTHSETDTEEPRPLALVVGFGPCGRSVCEHLAERGLRILVVEQNPDALAEIRKFGYSAEIGDASHAELLEHTHVDHAVVVVVTVPDPRAVADIVSQVRTIAPHTVVVARSRYHRAAAAIEAAGAHAVIDEEHEVARGIVRSCAELLDGKAGTAEVASSAEGLAPFSGKDVTE